MAACSRAGLVAGGPSNRFLSARGSRASSTIFFLGTLLLGNERSFRFFSLQIPVQLYVVPVPYKVDALYVQLW